MTEAEMMAVLALDSSDSNSDSNSDGNAGGGSMSAHRNGTTSKLEPSAGWYANKIVEESHLISQCL